jgi:hypothetical protein
VSSSTGNSAPPPKEPSKEEGKLARLFGRPGRKKGETEKRDEDTSKRFQDFFERT